MTWPKLPCFKPKAVFPHADLPDMLVRDLCRPADTDPTHRAFLQLAYEMWRREMEAVVSPSVDDRERNYRAGSAQAMMTFIRTVEGVREDWKQRAQKEG